MRVITNNQFINLFYTPPETYSEFKIKAKVKTSSGLVPLNEYVKRNKIPASDILELYNHINKRHEYLARYYEKSLRPTMPLEITDKPMPISSMNNNAKVHYKNIIRNMYYIDILKNTQSGLDNLPSFLSVLENLYKNHIIDYKLLTPSARHYTRENRIGSVFSSFFFRASIMNPYLIYSLNHRVLKGERIFTPTLGWSSYCYGFLECPNVTDYVGVDIIPSVCKKTEEFAREYYPKKTVDIYCKPSEDLLMDSKFMHRYKGYFDVVFFSPPYYNLEIYQQNNKNQSTTRYKNYEDWLMGYWKKTILLCSHVLSKGGRLCYIISDYDEFELVKDLKNIVIDIGGFVFKRMIRMGNKTVVVNKGQDDNSESICIFEKL